MRLLLLLYSISCVIFIPMFARAEAGQTEAGIIQKFEPHRGQTIGGIPILCDSAMCSDLTTLNLLLKVARLSDKKGQPLEPEAIAKAWSRLSRTGYFRSLDVEPQVHGNRVFVQFTGEAHVIITDLKIEYATWASKIYPKQFESEVKKRLILRKGGEFPPQQPDGSFDPADRELLMKQKLQIMRLYEQQGFIGTQIDILPEYYGHNKKQVKVTILIHEGTQPHLGEALVEGNEALPYWKVVSPLSTNERVDFIPDFFDIFGVGSYERRQLKEEISEIEDIYHDEGYYGARVRLDRMEGAQEGVIELGDTVRPLIRINEGPKIDIIFEGNESLSEEDLLEVITFRKSGNFDEAEVSDSVAAIIELYQTTARYRTTVESQVDYLDNKHVRVTFTIHESDTMYVRRVEIYGPKQVSVEQVADVMETKGVAEHRSLGPMVSAGVIQDARLINDLVAIRDLYKGLGFSGVRFRCSPADLSPDEWAALRAPTESNDSWARLERTKPNRLDRPFDIWSADPVNNRCFMLFPDDEDPNLMILRIELDEGLQTTTDGFEVKKIIKSMDERFQDEAYSILQGQGITDEFRQYQKDIPLTEEKIDAVRSFILRHYQRQGYLQAQVTPVCSLEDGTVLDCTASALYGLHLPEVKFDITPGPQTFVDGILVRGNLRTKHHIIERELQLKDQHPLGSDELFLSQANLRSLGIFESVSIETIGTEETDVATKNAALLVTLEEGRYQQLDAYLGLQLDSNVSSDLPLQYLVGATIRDRNFLGRAVELGLGANHANRWDTPQDVGGDDAIFEIGPFFKDPRFLATRLDLSMEATYSRSMTPEHDRYAEVYSTAATIGYDFLNLSYPSDWGRGLRATFTLEWRRERRRALTSKGERPAFSDPTHSVGLTPGFSWDKRDSPLHPTRGWLVMGTAEIITADMSLDNMFQTPSFKETLTGEYILPLFKRRLLIVPMLRLGAVQTDEKEENLKSSFLFKAGGDGVTYPVRGYAAAGIDACHGNENGGRCSEVFAKNDDDKQNPLTVGGTALALSTLELRMPTFVVENLWLAFFSDTAFISHSWGDFGSDQLYPSVGFGVRYLVTGQIPLRLDIGYPLRETVFSPQTARLHFNLFYSL